MAKIFFGYVACAIVLALAESSAEAAPTYRYDYDPSQQPLRYQAEEKSSGAGGYDPFYQPLSAHASQLDKIVNSNQTHKTNSGYDSESNYYSYESDGIDAESQDGENGLPLEEGNNGEEYSEWEYNESPAYARKGTSSKPANPDTGKPTWYHEYLDNQRAERIYQQQRSSNAYAPQPVNDSAYTSTWYDDYRQNLRTSQRASDRYCDQQGSTGAHGCKYWWDYEHQNPSRDAYQANQRAAYDQQQYEADYSDNSDVDVKFPWDIASSPKEQARYVPKQYHVEEPSTPRDAESKASDATRTSYDGSDDVFYTRKFLMKEKVQGVGMPSNGSTDKHFLNWFTAQAKHIIDDKDHLLDSYPTLQAQYIRSETLREPISPETIDSYNYLKSKPSDRITFAEKDEQVVDFYRAGTDINYINYFSSMHSANMFYSQSLNAEVSAVWKSLKKSVPWSGLTFHYVSDDDVNWSKKLKAGQKLKLTDVFANTRVSNSSPFFQLGSIIPNSGIYKTSESRPIVFAIDSKSAYYHGIFTEDPDRTLDEAVLYDDGSDYQVVAGGSIHGQLIVFMRQLDSNSKAIRDYS